MRIEEVIESQIKNPSLDLYEEDARVPELPEVENTKLSLMPLKNQNISDFYTSGKSLRKPITNLVQLKDSSIIDICRKAKYLLFHLSNSQTIVSHLGMSGSFLYSKDKKIDKHDHIILYFQNGFCLKYNDPRRFGLFVIDDTSNYLSNYFHNIAYDATDENFNGDYLFAKLSKIKSNIKNTLLDQKIVAGIGNIYASEALHMSRILPMKEAKDLSKDEVNRLADSIKIILQKAISLGGSTLKNYKKADGNKGDFQNHFLVYGREGKPCINCNCNYGIQKIIQNGRSTFYCKNIQK